MTSRPDDDDLEERLAELEATLGELRTELESQSSRRFPRPPSPGDLLRFTEQYTIPTLIAFLEAAIRSLELLQRALRLADPGRAAHAESAQMKSGVDRVRSEAADHLADNLADLRRALSGAELPESTPPETRQLLEDARALTDEIEDRLRETRDPGRSTNHTPSGDSRSRDGNGGGVTIDITDEHDADEEPIDDPSVDVDSELQSIKDELSGEADGSDEKDRSVEADDSDEDTPDEETPNGDTPDGDDPSRDGSDGDDSNEEPSGGKPGQGSDRA